MSDSATSPYERDGSTPKLENDLTQPLNKPTNPKDGLGSNRSWLSLVSPVACAEEALALTEGGLKYGRNNYRVMGVSASIYLDALHRHYLKYTYGGDRDPATKVHHLGSVRACCGIILDAHAYGVLNDDRPPRIEGFEKWLDDQEKYIKHLKEMFKDRSPKHWTIGDQA